MLNLTPKKIVTPHPVYSATARSPEVQAAYDDYRRELRANYGNEYPCPFCHDTTNRVFIRERGSMIVMTNDYPYSTYDGLVVVQHLLLLPKRHVAMFSDFTIEEQRDYWNAYSELSDQGFNTMTRAVGNSRRSVATHLHTHLFSYHDI